MAGLAPSAIAEGKRLLTEFKGALTENYILESLIGQFENRPRYWTSQNRAEVDFVLQVENEIIPIEVKSDENVTGKSLTFYRKIDGIDLCWRLDVVGNSLLLAPFNIIGASLYKLLTLDKTNRDTLSKIPNFQLYTPKNGFSSLRHINSCFTKHNGEILFRQQYSDTVYTYHTETYSIRPKYIFDFENKKLTMDILADVDKFKDAVYISELYDLDHYIHVLLSIKDQYRYYIIDKNSGTVHPSKYRLRNNQ